MPPQVGLNFIFPRLYARVINEQLAGSHKNRQHSQKRPQHEPCLLSSPHKAQNKHEQNDVALSCGGASNRAERASSAPTKKKRKKVAIHHKCFPSCSRCAFINIPYHTILRRMSQFVHFIHLRDVDIIYYYRLFCAQGASIFKLFFKFESKRKSHKPCRIIYNTM